MLIPRIPSLLLLREKKFMTRRPSTFTRHCSVRLSPIAENSPLLPPVGVWAVSQSQYASPSSGGFLLLLLSLRGISSRFQLLFPSQG
ncbi:hypothetical protein VNO80_31235 [Phaseolus coccineus]|uniref:Uncharacterized protein n=1 Tax=Phaseolus coccineus TaxID=3886 RepID=A0AAN9LC50_PHACN